MEYDISLNFQFNDAEMKRKIAAAFQELANSNNDEAARTIFSFADSEDGQAALSRLIDTYPGIDLLRHADVRVLKSKIAIDILAGHEESEFVSAFMGFIRALGGKPLTSKASGEQGDVYTYKFSASGMTTSYREPDDEEW